MPQIKQPAIGVGAVIFKDDAILLVKRKNPPCQNEWAIPGGKVKLGESLKQAAEREVLEETGVIIEAGKIIYTFELIERDKEDNILFHYVIIDLAADYLSGELKANDDAVEARWLTTKDILDLNINQNTRDLLQKKYNYAF